MSVKFEYMTKDFDLSTSIVENFNNLYKQLGTNQLRISKKNIEQVLNKSYIALALTDSETKLVGIGILCPTNTLKGVKSHIEEVVVDAQYRGMGIGEKIMEMLVDKSRKINSYSVELTSSPKRKEANSLYQKLGFKLRQTNPYILINELIF
jgi:phosphinothricin acetyltransferase